MTVPEFFFPREEISLQHKLIPKYMANWNIVKAVASAERKLQLVKDLEGEMKTLLPSSLLELYEMYRLALVRTKSIIFILFHLVNLIIIFFRLLMSKFLKILKFLRKKLVYCQSNLVRDL